MKNVQNYPVTRTNWMPSVLTAFDELFDQTALKQFPFLKSAPMNIKETEAGFEVEFAAPGLKKEDFKIELEKDMLHVSAEVQKSSEMEEKGKYKRREFTSGSFNRSVRLSENIDTENISASYVDGVLLIKLSHKAPDVKVNRTISVE